jgi:hypothetical protein
LKKEGCGLDNWIGNYLLLMFVAENSFLLFGSRNILDCIFLVGSFIWILPFVYTIKFLLYYHLLKFYWIEWLFIIFGMCFCFLFKCAFFISIWINFMKNSKFIISNLTSFVSFWILFAIHFLIIYYTFPFYFIYFSIH